ncbi:MAG: hypothetical protein JW863_10185 [Chitinispirillaceae bacterium]|nr:hypothetical protein [Chitinispirillaceae bacterium]
MDTLSDSSIPGTPQCPAYQFVILSLSFLLLINSTAFSEGKKPLKANLLIYSAGSWMVFSDKPAPYAFNKFTRTLYGQIFGLSGMAKIPLDLTIPNTSTAPRMWFGDFDFYVGKRFGWIEPRIGLELPLGYAIDDDWKKKAWIGTNNVRLQTGFSISRTHFETIGLPFGAEAMMSVALTEKNAHYERGTINGSLYLKTSRNFLKKLNGGLELAVYGKSGIPTWSRTRKRENGITLLPALFGSFRTAKKMFIGVKFGFGPSFGVYQNSEQSEHRSNSMDCGISIQYYP